MLRLNLKLIALLVVIFGCSRPKLFISDFQNLRNLENSILVYSLPQTVINVEVVFQKTVFVPGPYHEFADKYLALKGVSHDSYESFAIKKITVEAAVEQDPDYYFSLSSSGFIKDFDVKINNLVQDGLILLPGSCLMKGTLCNESDVSRDEIHYKDLSVKRNLVVEKETTYKRVFRDSAYIQVPFETELLKVKPLEKKAEEAANFIIKLRKRKFKLLTGQNEGPLSDNGIQAYIDELNRIENEYLSLFTGKKYQERVVRNFEYIPSSDKEYDQRILFSLSEREGIYDLLSPGGVPFTLEIKSKEVTAGFDNLIAAAELPDVVNTVYYRHPDLAHIRLKLGDAILSEGKFTVFQFGPVISQKLVFK